MSASFSNSKVTFKTGAGDVLVEVEATGDATLSIHGATGEGVLLANTDADRKYVLKATNSMAVGDSIAGVDTTATRTITLPAMSASTTGRQYTVKDVTGSAGTNSITVDTPGAETIDGGASVVISSHYDNVTVFSNGSHVGREPDCFFIIMSFLRCGQYRKKKSDIVFKSSFHYRHCHRGAVPNGSGFCIRTSCKDPVK